MFLKPSQTISNASNVFKGSTKITAIGVNGEIIQNNNLAHACPKLLLTKEKGRPSMKRKKEKKT